MAGLHDSLNRVGKFRRVFWSGMQDDGLDDDPPRQGYNQSGETLMVTDTTRLPIAFDPHRIAEFCRDRGIARLSVFGSVLREDFDPVSSDVDVLADFKPGAVRGIGFRFFGYGDELAEILGRKVDFCTRLNPHIEPIIRSEALMIYEE